MDDSIKIQRISFFFIYIIYGIVAKNMKDPKIMTVCFLMLYWNLIWNDSDPIANYI